MFKTRIISSQGCPTCKFYLRSLKKQGFDHEVYDADIKENQAQLDEWKISNMPVVQIIDVETNKKIFQFPSGIISPNTIRRKMRLLAKGQS